VREEITGEWRKLQNEELFDFYCSPNIIRANKLKGKGWVRHVVGKRGRGRKAYSVSVDKLEGKGQLG